MDNELNIRLLKNEKRRPSPLNSKTVAFVNHNFKTRKTVSSIFSKYVSKLELIIDPEDLLARITNSPDDPIDIVMVDFQPTETERERWEDEYLHLPKTPLTVMLCNHIENSQKNLAAQLQIKNIVELSQTDEAVVKQIAALIDSKTDIDIEDQEKETKITIVEEDEEAQESHNDDYIKTGNAKLDEMAAILKIPPPPEEIKQLHKLLDGRPKPNEIEEIIEPNYKLKNTVLKLLNAQFFNFGVKSKINSVAHAINLVGLDPFISITFAMALKSTLSQRTGKISDFAYKFWKYSFANAIACVYLAPNVERVWPEFSVGKAFLLGAVHNSGMLLMAKEFDGYTKILENDWRADHSGCNQCHLESESYNFDHGLASFAVARAWGLSDQLLDPILYHHEDQELDNKEEQAMLNALKLSNYVTNHYLFNNFDYTLIEDKITKVAEQFGESMAELKKIKDNVRSQLMLNINTLSR